jgi:hypothetical protein
MVGLLLWLGCEGEHSLYKRLQLCHSCTPSRASHTARLPVQREHGLSQLVKQQLQLQLVPATSRLAWVRDSRSGGYPVHVAAWYGLGQFINQLVEMHGESWTGSSM